MFNKKEKIYKRVIIEICMEKNDFQNAFGEIVEKGSGEHGNHFSFVPNKLPPKIEYDKELALDLSKADSTLSKLSGAGLLLPNSDLLVIPYLKKEALSSSRIEGTRISLSDYFLSEAQDLVKKDAESTEVGNYIKAMNYALEKIKTEPITLDLIKEMHKMLMEGVRGDEKIPGNFRPVQNWIGPPNTKIQKATFVPPPYEDVEKLMQQLVDYMNTNDETPLLIKIALIHYQFETIHPFCDGNGRIGRALITLYLCKKNKISKPLLYTSDYFEKYRSEYYNKLLRTNQTGEFKDWLKFFLDAIKTQSEDALDRTIKIQNLREEYRKKLQKETQSNNLIEIIDSLFINPFVQTTQIAKRLDVSYPTAKKSVNKLIKLGILKPVGDRERNRLFVAHEILNIITV